MIIVSYLNVTSCRLDFGYIFHPDGKMDTMERSDFEFHNWGDDGEAPEYFEVNFIAGMHIFFLWCNSKFRSCHLQSSLISSHCWTG